MALYDFQTATAERIAEIFRAATVGDNSEEILQGGRRRVLLADEVGLGKTHVAAKVIELVKEMRREVKDDMFRVIYVCSNMSIAAQNIQKLGIGNTIDVSLSRLSMQHLTIRKKEAQSKSPDSDEMGEIIIPITPATSFSLTGHAMGNACERALIARILLQLDEFKEYSDWLKVFFQGKSKDGWKETLKFINTEVDKLCNLDKKYLSDIKNNLYHNPDFHSVKDDLIKYFNDNNIEDFKVKDDIKSVKNIINRLRRIFADLSLSMLKPDLIIMDEFQRFSSLLDYDNGSEQSAVARKFFEQGEQGDSSSQQPMILLLSATPYKPYTTLEELADSNHDAHYDDFHKLMKFLFKRSGNVAKEDDSSDTEDYNFKKVWEDYSNKLSHISTSEFEVLLASKKSAEKMMYQSICRTERLRESLIHTDETVRELSISSDDILSYCEMQNIVRACKEASLNMPGKKFSWANVPMDYVKSSPYLLSFMDKYELKSQIKNIYEDKRANFPKPSERVLLRRKDIENFRPLPMRNARMEYLSKMMLGPGNSAALLLWVPASRPYYHDTKNDFKNPFAINRDFSKVIVFSAWEMVPRMVSTLMTYEVERIATPSGHKKSGYESTTGENRLKTDAQEILTFPSEYLAGLYDPQKYFNSDIKQIKEEIKAVIEKDLEGIPVINRRNYSKILNVLKWLEDRGEPRTEDIPANTANLLTDMAIASPGVCLYRLLKDKDLVAGRDNSQKGVAQNFVSLFNTRIAGNIIDRFSNKLKIKFKGANSYLDKVMRYCVMGNLQAVLDEYAHLICADGKDSERNKKIARQLRDSFLGGANLKVDTDCSFASSDDKFSMRISYAVPYAKLKSDASEKSFKRSNSVRNAFQSPFYPFVLTSTSVGQEGLDFHWYCRKVMHWNLPSNPQNLEQREGRINRFKCLAIRRNLSRMDCQSTTWEDLFENAQKRVKAEFDTTYPEIVPNWCLPQDWIDKDKENIEWIERIVPQYPLSNDVSRYNRLIKVLTLYRLTLGQPRQEELLTLLEQKGLTQEQVDELLFNLSPIKR